MGLASSQARLLLLTARKSDLEYRAQQITNSEMILAMQTEEVAREYSVKISNQTILFMSTDKEQSTQKISASLLASLAGGNGYKLQYKDADGHFYDWSATTTTPKVYMSADGSGDYIDATKYQSLTADEKAKYNSTPVDRPGGAIQGLDDFDGQEILEGIKNGTMQIVNANGEVQDLNGNNSFTTTYYTDDDREAEAEYDRKTASIQVKEKRLQNDLNQVETQQKACDTEIDSVKKVMEKNIERTFKVFS